MFRDDREALLARVDAHQREADRLREENEELRAREGARCRGREARGGKARDVEGAKRGAEIERPQSHYEQSPKLRDEAMAPSWSRFVRFAGVVTPLPALAGYLYVFFYKGNSMMALFGVGPILVLWLLAAELVYIVAVRVGARHERRRLAAWPIPLEREAYFAVLATPQSSKTLEVRVTFADEPLEATRHAITDAVRDGASEVAAIRWLDGELVIESPRIETMYRRRRPDNVGLHRWFHRLAIEVLIPLARTYPMTAVRVA